MNKLLALMVLCGSVALPAVAQMTPAQTNLDPAAGQLETRNARADRELTGIDPEQALANALQRCAALPPFYRTDCEARVRGQGLTSGSVIGGGIVSETITTMPKDQLEALERNPREMAFPRPLGQHR